MNRKLWPQGSEQNFSQFIQDLQQTGEDNLSSRLKLFLHPGISSDASALKLTAELNANSNQFEWVLQPGWALTPQGELIQLVEEYRQPLVFGMPGFAIVYLEWTPEFSGHIKALNAFNFNQTSTGLSKPTRQTNSFRLVVEEAQANQVVLSELRAQENKIPLAVLTFKDTPPAAGVTPLVENWLNAAPNYQEVAGLVDVRQNSRSYFKAESYKPGDVFRHDRANTITFPTTFAELIQVAQLNIDTFTLETQSGNLEIKTSAFTATLSSEGTLTLPVVRAQAMQVDLNEGVGEPNWVPVLTGKSAPSQPRFLRIQDVKPTSQPDEPYGFVEFKWNWSEFENTNQIYFNAAENTTVIPVSLPGNSLDRQALIGSGLFNSKMLLVGNSEYIIVDAELTGSQITEITVAGEVTGVDYTASNTGAFSIIDRNVDYFYLTLEAVENQEQLTFQIPSSVRRLNRVQVRVPLGQSWIPKFTAITLGAPIPTEIFLRAENNEPVAGDRSFEAVLPNLIASGSVTLTATKSGFEVTITGWAGEAEQRPHEFEIVYSSVNTVTEDLMNNANAPVSRVVTRNRYIAIPSPEPTSYSVAIRPLQNKQAVSLPQISSIQSGGGGIAPNETILFQDFIQVKPLRFAPVDKVDDANWIFTSFTEGLNKPELLSQADLRNLKLVELTTVEDLIALPIPPESIKSSQPATSFEGNPYEIIAQVRTDNDATAQLPEAGVTAVFSVNEPLKKATFLDLEEQVSSIGLDYFTWPEAPMPANSANWAELQFNSRHAEAYTILTPGQTYTLQFLGHAAPGAAGEARVELVDLTTNEVLTTSRHSFHPSMPQQGVIKLTYFNDSLNTREVRARVRVWGQLSTTRVYTALDNALADEELFTNGLYWIKIYTPQEKPQTITYTNNQGGTQQLFSQAVTRLRNATISESEEVPPNAVAINTQGAVVLPGEEPHYQVQIAQGGISEDKLYTAGTTKEGRFVTTVDLAVSFTITHVKFTPAVCYNISPVVPGIIRIYPKGQPDSAAMLAVETVTQEVGATPNLHLRGTDSNSFGFTVDCFDPSNSNNNRSYITGTLTVYGRPTVKTSF